jgi:hypothetical protein
MSCHIYCLFQLPLMIGAGSRHSPRHHLTTFRNKIFQKFWILVIDWQIRVLAEFTNSFPHVNPFFLPILSPCRSCWSWHLYPPYRVILFFFILKHYISLRKFCLRKFTFQFVKDNMIRWFFQALLFIVNPYKHVS